MRAWLLVGATLVVACSGKQQQVVSVMPSVGPNAVASAFMQAVADSNLSAMGELWGTNKGPAATTNEPTNWLQRMAVIQAYLRGGTSKILGDVPGAVQPDRRQIAIELNRSGCVKQVPFTMILTKKGAWLVNSIDLNAAGVPGRACQGATGTPRS